jgi:hypothetical protein
VNRAAEVRNSSKQIVLCFLLTGRIGETNKIDCFNSEAVH